MVFVYSVVVRICNAECILVLHVWHRRLIGVVIVTSL